ncbi:SAM-dependent methyltransferase [Nocardia sp. NPDC050793]|uniref:class I SAM-dependent methyltransferase n=1 Tax=Nocardia sp. NPDC050793 TaxID=3155159 RepID=UPI0033F5E4F6
MEDNQQPSRTALMSAAARAAHLVDDDAPSIFADPLAHAFLGKHAEELLGYHRSFGDHPVLSGARTTATTRSRYTEDQLARLVGQGVSQYVILGAGLDSFAYRSELADRVRVFEVDKSITQRWKQQLLAETSAALPPSVAFVRIDLEQEPSSSLPDHLARAGFRCDEPALISWLGVTMYVTLEAIQQTLAVLGGFAPGTELVVEHLLPAGHRDEIGQAYAELVMAATAEQGEPWKTFLTVEDMDTLLRVHGLRPVEHARQRDTVAPALWERTDTLCPFDLSILSRATIPARP